MGVPAELLSGLTCHVVLVSYQSHQWLDDTTLTSLFPSPRFGRGNRGEGH